MRSIRRTAESGTAATDLAELRGLAQWPAWSQQWWFGDEPVPASSVTPLAETVDVFYLHLQSKYREVRAGADRNPLANDVWESLKVAAPHAPPPPGDALRVVLMGRTMAGKSTLFAALSGLHADRIGDGRQRFSRDVLVAPLRDLPDVELVDTPGVGAHDGAEDYALAMREAETADLVLWIASNDSFQEETAKALRLLATCGKPIVVVLNCRKALSDDFARDDFLDDPGAVFAQQQGNFNRIRAHLHDAGVRPIVEIAIHAAAAQYALADTAHGAKLTVASRIAELLAAITHDFARRREQRRVLRLVDGVRDQAANLDGAVRRAVWELRGRAERERGAALDLLARQQREVDRAQETLESSVITSIGRRREWHLTVANFGRTLEQEWAHQVEVLTDEIQSAIDTEIANLGSRLQSVGEDVTREWTQFPPGDFGLGSIPDFRSVKWSRMARAGVAGSLAAAALGGGALGAKIGFVIGLEGGPLALVTAAGGAVAGAVAGVVGKLLVGLSRRIFKGKAQILAERREHVRQQVGPVLDDLSAKVQRALAETSATIQRGLTTSHIDALRICSEAERSADQWDRACNSLQVSVTAVDTTTTAWLLRMQGRHRLVAGLVRASRNPGVCVVATMEANASDEAWLFPPDSPETTTFAAQTSGPDTSAQELPFVLGLSGYIAALTSWRPDAATVVLPAEVAVGVRSAWSDILTHHTGKAIRIIDGPPDQEKA